MKLETKVSRVINGDLPVYPLDAAMLLLAQLMVNTPRPFCVDIGCARKPNGAVTHVVVEIAAVKVAMTPDVAIDLAEVIEEVIAETPVLGPGPTKEEWLDLAETCRQEAKAVQAGTTQEQST